MSRLFNFSLFYDFILNRFNHRLMCTFVCSKYIQNYMPFIQRFSHYCFLLLTIVSCKHDTNPSTPLKELSFLVVGDWGRNGTQNQQEVANQMNRTALKANAQFVISTGDNFYESGVQSINDSQWETSFEKVYSGIGLQKDWLVALGNHDCQGNPKAQIDYSNKSPRWKMPSRYFTSVKVIDDMTSVRLVFIDSNPFVKEYLQNPKAYSDIAIQDTQKQLV